MKQGAFSFFTLAMVLVALDQATKTMVTSNLALHESIEVLPGLLNICHVTNTGAAFGILAGPESWRHLFFQVISILALGFLSYFYLSSRDKNAYLFFGASLVLGGAAGNLIDRVRLGSVIDFIDFHVGIHHWPAFNLADSAITMGGILLAFHLFRSTDKSI